MPRCPTRLTHDDNDDVSPASEVSVPPGKEAPRVRALDSSNDHVGIGQHLSDLVAMSRQQLGVLVLDVALSFFGQFDLTMEPGTGKTPDHVPSIASTSRPANVQ